MSDIEKYWAKICVAYGSTKAWTDLSPNQQNAIIQSVNILLAVLDERIQ